MFNNTVSFLVCLLCASWFTQQVISAPIRTHPSGKTHIWVTDKNTLNASQPLQDRSLERRQWGRNFGPGFQRGNPWATTLYPFPGPTTWGPGPDTTFFPPPPPGTFTSLPTTSPSPPPPPPPGTSIPPPPPDTSTVPPPPASTTVTSTTVTSTALTTVSIPTSGVPTTSVPPPPASTTLTTVPTPSSGVATTSVPPPPASTTLTTLTTVPIPSSSVATTSAPPPPPTTSSSPPPPTTTSSPPPSGGGNTLQMALVNNLGSNNVNAYITGLDTSGQVVMVTADGAFYYVASPGTTTPQLITANVAIPLAAQGQTTQVTIPDYISSARVWFADGTLDFYVVDTQYGPGLVEPTSVNPDDPSADVNWGFVELTFIADSGLFANLSFVDFVGLPLGMELQTSSSGTQSALGMPADAVSQVCNLLKGKASQDGQPWDQLCVTDNSGNLIRVVAPSTLISTDGNAFSSYWDDYINKVWQQYTSQQLTVDTQAGAGNVACTSDGTTITCAGDNAGYTKPSAADIFGCNTGPFAIAESDNDVHQAVVPRLCAAIHRATLDQSGGNVQPSLPPSAYYQTDVNNWYSAYVHQVEAAGKGYAFPYDDVAPNDNENVSGSVAAADPTLLTVYIGGSSG